MLLQQRYQSRGPSRHVHCHLLRHWGPFLDTTSAPTIPLCHHHTLFSVSEELGCVNWGGSHNLGAQAGNQPKWKKWEDLVKKMEKGKDLQKSLENVSVGQKPTHIGKGCGDAKRIHGKKVENEKKKIQKKPNSPPTHCNPCIPGILWCPPNLLMGLEQLLIPRVHASKNTTHTFVKEPTNVYSAPQTVKLG